MDITLLSSLQISLWLCLYNPFSIVLETIQLHQIRSSKFLWKNPLLNWANMTVYFLLEHKNSLVVTWSLRPKKKIDSMDSVRLWKVKCGVRSLHTFFYFTLQRKGKMRVFHLHFCVFICMQESLFMCFSIWPDKLTDNDDKVYFLF